MPLPPGTRLRNGNGQLTDVSLIFSVWGGVSLLGSLFLVFSFVVKKQLRTQTLLRVLYMSIADACFSAKFVFSGLVGIPLQKGSFACNLSGAVGLFSWNATIGWYNVISMAILATLNDRFKRSIINTNPVVQHLLVWPLSISLAVYAWAADWYQPVNDGTECWFGEDQQSSLRKLFNSAPLLVYIVIACCVLVYSHFRLAAMTGVSSAHRRMLLRRMWLFCGVFVLTFSFSLVDLGIRIFSSDPGTAPQWLGIVDLIGIVGSGAFNFIVWVTSPAFTNAFCRDSRLPSCCIEKEDVTTELDATDALGRRRPVKRSVSSDRGSYGARAALLGHSDTDSDLADFAPLPIAAAAGAGAPFLVPRYGAAPTGAGSRPSQQQQQQQRGGGVSGAGAARSSEPRFTENGLVIHNAPALRSLVDHAGQRADRAYDTDTDLESGDSVSSVSSVRSTASSRSAGGGGGDDAGEYDVISVRGAGEPKG